MRSDRCCGVTAAIQSWALAMAALRLYLRGHNSQPEPVKVQRSTFSPFPKLGTSHWSLVVEELLPGVEGIVLTSMIVGNCPKSPQAQPWTQHAFHLGLASYFYSVPSLIHASLLEYWQLFELTFNRGINQGRDSTVISSTIPERTKLDFFLSTPAFARLLLLCWICKPLLSLSAVKQQHLSGGFTCGI